MFPMWTDGWEEEDVGMCWWVYSTYCTVVTAELLPEPQN